MKQPKPKAKVKSKGGRPRVPAAQRREKQFHLLMYIDEYQRLYEWAKKNQRSTSEEMMQRVRATFAEPRLYEDAKALEQGNVEKAIDVLLAKGWIRAHDPRYGGAVLLPPGSSPPGSFIPAEQSPIPLPAIVAAENVERTLRGVFDVWGIPVEQRSAIREGLFRTLIKHLPKRREEKETDAPKTEQPTASETKANKTIRGGKPG